nr:hypothetical protein [Morchella crassipes]
MRTHGGPYGALQGGLGGDLLASAYGLGLEGGGIPQVLQEGERIEISPPPYSFPVGSVGYLLWNFTGGSGAFDNRKRPSSPPLRFTPPYTSPHLWWGRGRGRDVMGATRDAEPPSLYRSSSLMALWAKREEERRDPPPPTYLNMRPGVARWISWGAGRGAPLEWTFTIYQAS